MTHDLAIACDPASTDGQESDRLEPDGLKLVTRGRRVDLAAARRAAAQFLTALGIDLDQDGLRETPARLARAYAEFFDPPPNAVHHLRQRGGIRRAGDRAVHSVPHGMRAPFAAVFRRRACRIRARRAYSRLVQTGSPRRALRGQAANTGAPDQAGRGLPGRAPAPARGPALCSRRSIRA